MSNSSLNPTTNTMEYPYEVPSPLQIFIMYIVTGGALLTNLTVFYTVPRLQAKINSSTRLAILNLAITDALIGINGLISRTIYITSPAVYSRHWCQIDALLNPVAGGMSILGLTFLNVDKFLTLKFPLRYKICMTYRKSIVTLFAIWLVVILYYMQMVFVPAQDLYRENAFICFGYIFSTEKISALNALQITDIVLFLALPFFMSVCALVGIGCILKSHRTTVGNLQEGQQGFSANDRSVVYAIFVLNLTFLFMITPFFICNHIWRLFTGAHAGPVTSFITLWLAAANSAINPLIYIPSVRSYRQELKRGLQKLFSRGNAENVTTTQNIIITTQKKRHRKQ